MGACCCCCGTSTSGQDIVFINGEPYMRVKPGSVAPAPRPATKRHVWRDIVFGVDRMDLKPHKQDLFDVVLKVDSLVSGETMVTIEPPKTGKRVPVDICCVVDVSGSMSAEATVKNAQVQPSRTASASWMSPNTLFKLSYKCLARTIDCRWYPTLVTHHWS